MNDEEELELIDAFEVEDKTKEFVPVGEKQVLPTRREAHRRTREIPVEENQELQQQKDIKYDQLGMPQDIDKLTDKLQSIYDDFINSNSN